jgi:septum formation protein
MLLRQVGLEFQVVPSGLDESPDERASPRETAEGLALAKARHVAAGRGSGLVIGADTVVVVDDRVLGKPSGPEEAASMIRVLSGRAHQVITGVAVVDAATGRARSDAVVTKVRFASLDDPAIRRYVATGEPLDKAGGYAIQGYGSLLIEGIDGDYFNVVGLPLRRLAELLGEFGFDAFASLPSIPSLLRIDAPGAPG